MCGAQVAWADLDLSVPANAGMASGATRTGLATR
jgi:hypothetical protein